MLNLHIGDVLHGASPGTVLPSPETTTLRNELAALVGRKSAARVLKYAGRIGVFHMAPRELAATASIPFGHAHRIAAARQLFDGHTPSRTPTVHSARALVAMLPRGLGNLETEVLLAVALTGRLEPTATVLVAKGGVDSAAVLPRDVFMPLVRLNARTCVLVHNHPSGDPTPSEQDIRLTNTLSRFGHFFGMNVVDHIVVGRSEICSFAELGLLLDRATLEAEEARRGF